MTDSVGVLIYVNALLMRTATVVVVYILNTFRVFNERVTGFALGV